MKINEPVEVSASSVTGCVKEFYEQLPFNMHKTVAEACRVIRSANQIMKYQPVHDLLRPGGLTVLDVGCGTGWFANSAGRYYSVWVTGVDLCGRALRVATKVSEGLGIRRTVKFLQGDLFNLPFREGFHLVNSLGVLHHTPDCRGALAAVSRYVQPGGYLHIGLYHAYGRRPFLDLFQTFRDQLREARTPEEKGKIEDLAFALYCELDRRTEDPVALRSWFKDQVIHPHETQHTMKELYGWLKEMGFKPISTSLNGFQPVSDWGTVFAEEIGLQQVSFQRNVVERRYYPGFFVTLARRV